MRNTILRQAATINAVLNSRVLSLLAVCFICGCAHVAPNHEATSVTRDVARECPEIHNQVQAVADALKEYKKHHGVLPQSLDALIPDYLRDEECLWIHVSKKDDILSRMRLIYWGSSGPSSPRDKELRMVACTSRDCSLARYVIDSNLEVWYVGESAFQDWLAGVDSFKSEE